MMPHEGPPDSGNKKKYETSGETDGGATGEAYGGTSREVSGLTLKWTLADLFSSPESPEIEKTFRELDACVTSIESVRALLGPEIDGGRFVAILSEMERFASAVSRIGAFGQLWFSEDTQNGAALDFIGRTEEALTRLSNRIVFFELWWKSLDSVTAERLTAFSGRLKYYLDNLRNFKDHTLSEPEEKLINTKDLNGINALMTIYDMLTNKFVFHLEVEGKKLELTRDALMVYVRSEDPALREAAYKELFAVYAGEQQALSRIYVYRVRDWFSEQVELRRFSSPLAVRNLANDVPDKAVEVLLDVCVEEAGVFHRYFRMKAGWLGMERLRRYDLYAPIEKSSVKKIPYDKAVETVLDSFDRFSPEAARLARRVFDERHIDAEDRPGKRGGAFCYSVTPKLTPWVLANYTGEPRQVATLAHELGHAIHSMMASGHSVLTFHSTLPLAETASVFSEMLLTDRLLEEEKDPGTKRLLLSAAIDDIYATVMRQAYFVLFERRAHKLINDGGSDLDTLYLSLLKSQFGDSVDVSDDFRLEWVAIPHLLHTPFYCYSYSFGELLSLSLYQKYKQEGPTARDAFLKILSYGGSESPTAILSEAGIDITNPDFWRGGFRFVERMIDQLE